MENRCLNIDFLLSQAEPLNLETLVTNIGSQVITGKHSRRDESLYTGEPGVCVMFLRANEPLKAMEILEKWASKFESAAHRYPDVAPSLLCGATGFYYVMALATSRCNGKNPKPYLNGLAKLASLALESSSDEWLYGRAGYLFACLSVSQKCGAEKMFQDIITRVATKMVESGFQYAQTHQSSTSPLMYNWPPGRHPEEYLGAAHGVMGIWYMLLFCEQQLSHDHMNLVEKGIQWLLTQRKANGNWSAVLGEKKAKLVHFCHGAPGAVFLFAKAYEVFKKNEYLQAALSAGEIVYKYGVLRKGPGLCHGIAGNGYTFLCLYKLTRNEIWLERARNYARLLQLKLDCRTPDNLYSLFEGLAGTVCFLLDLKEPLNARFPLFEL